ncbi:MAG: 4'-phosphopantetheinyl transferase superfamily protein [Pusillimonas sp.]
MTPDRLNLRIANGKPALSPTDIRIARGGGRAWLFGFVDDARLQEGLLALLADDEQARASAFVVSSARNHYVQTRAVLRLLLGYRLGVPAETLVFEYGPYGKPSLRDGGGCGFNVAHSGGYALLAMAEDGLQVGVDIEQQRETSDLRALARMVLSASEARAWAALPDAERAPAFFSAWTAKEAIVKAVGRGLGLGLPSLDLGSQAAPEGGHRVDAGEFGSCRLTPLTVPAGYAAALALHDPA